MALSRRTGGRSRLTIALLVITSLLLLTLDFRDAAFVQSARRTTASVFSPLRGVVEGASRPFTNAWRGIADYGDLENENEALRERLAELEGREVLEADAAQQLSELLAQQGLDWVGTIPTTAARVVSQGASNFSRTIDIDKGSDDGLAEGMPVVNGAGLVGRLLQVTPGRSTVRLISDPDFAVGVRVLPDGVTGTARGQGRGENLVVDTPLEAEEDTAPEPGTTLTTSGADGSVFPASIPVGKVTGVRKAAGGLTFDLLVAPLVDPERLAFVTVLLWQSPSSVGSVP